MMTRCNANTAWHLPFILLLLILSPSFLSGESTPRASFEVKAGPLTVSLHEEGKTHLSLLVSGSSIPTPDIFSIESPNRLVFDFPMQAPAVTKSQTRRGPLGLRSVRVAGHSDKLRVVLDFGEAALPSYTISPSTSPFTVHLGAALPKAPTTLPALSTVQATGVSVQRLERTPTSLPTPFAPPAVTETPLPKATRQPPVQPTVRPTVQPTAQPTPLTTPTLTPPEVPTQTPTPSPQATEPLPAATTQQLQALTFRQGGEFKTPTLVLSLSQRPTFKTSRRDDRTFRVVISDCELARNSLSLPYYPPGDFPGITMAIASPIGGNVEVSISVDRGWRITALPRGNEILITASDR